jgi:HK97 family phage prohead protease
MAIKLGGYAAIYGGLSASPFRPRHAPFHLRARFEPGAFDESLKYRDREIVALLDHRDSEILARRSDGTLRLWTDATGLAFEMNVNDSVPGLSGLWGMSVGFNCFDFRSEVVGAEQIWSIREAFLHEVSATSSPLFRQTSCRVIQPSVVITLPTRSAPQPIASPALESQLEDDRMENRIEVASHPYYQASGDHAQVRTFEEIWADGQKRLQKQAEKDEARPTQIDLLRRKLDLEVA